MSLPRQTHKTTHASLSSARATELMSDTTLINNECNENKGKEEAEKKEEEEKEET